MRTHTVLVSGLLPMNSGKTYFSASLANTLRKLGLKVVAFKPVAGHSMWYQFRVFSKSLKLGVLVGEDVIKYMELGLIKDPDKQNPIDILTATPDISSFRSVDEYLRALEDVIMQAVIVRVSTQGIRRYFLVNESLKSLPKQLRSEVVNALKVFSPVTRVSRLWLLNYLTSPEIDVVVSSATKEVLSMGDVVVIESFNNALVPIASLADVVDTLIIVAPGKALVYGGSKLRSYVSTIKSVNELESSRFVKFFRPDLEFDVPIFDSWPPKELPRSYVSDVLRIM